MSDVRKAAEALEDLACRAESYTVCEHGRFLHADVPGVMMRIAADLRAALAAEKCADCGDTRAGGRHPDNPRIAGSEHRETLHAFTPAVADTPTAREVRDFVDTMRRETDFIPLAPAAADTQEPVDVMAWARQLCIRERTGDASIRALHPPEPCDDCEEYAQFLVAFRDVPAAADTPLRELTVTEDGARQLIDAMESPPNPSDRLREAMAAAADTPTPEPVEEAPVATSAEPIRRFTVRGIVEPAPTPEPVQHRCRYCDRPYAHGNLCPAWTSAFSPLPCERCVPDATPPTTEKP